jgi:hypothetical protein
MGFLLGEPFHGAGGPYGLGGLRFAALLGRLRALAHETASARRSWHARLPAHDLKLHVDIAARGVGIGADLFVCLLD